MLYIIINFCISLYKKFVFNFFYTKNTNKNIAEFVRALGADPKDIDSMIRVYLTNKDKLSQRAMYCLNKQMELVSFIHYAYLNI